MIYCVIGKRLEPLVEQAFSEDDRVALGDGEWLVSADASTSKRVWELLVGHRSDAEGTSQPSGIVLSVHGYYGMRPASIWEWLVAKRRVDNGS